MLLVEQKHLATKIKTEDNCLYFRVAYVTHYRCSKMEEMVSEEPVSHINTSHT